MTITSYFVCGKEGTTSKQTWWGRGTAHFQQNLVKRGVGLGEVKGGTGLLLLLLRVLPLHKASHHVTQGKRPCVGSGTLHPKRVGGHI